MRILGIETSCDETAASIVENGTKILSNVISSSLSLHAKTGGIIPETAARQQIKYIIPVIDKALKESNLYSLSSKNHLQSSIIHRPDIDAIAVTVGPGLIGSLLVGVETAKTLAYAWNKPIIPVNHLIGHIYANFVCEMSNIKEIKFPAIVLLVSGGHTDLLLMKDHQKLKWLGGTRDDAAGEALDKIARLINLPYPGGPSVEKKALKGNPKAFNFPRPLNDSNDLDFSFSGLKTAVLREVKSIQSTHPVIHSSVISNISASVQQAIIDVLVKKTLKAAIKYKVKSILLSGGVSANQALRDRFALEIGNLPASPRGEKFDIGLFAPQAQLCTDNAAMIASAAFFNYKPVPWDKITANPELYFK